MMPVIAVLIDKVSHLTRESVGCAQTAASERSDPHLVAHLQEPPVGPIEVKDGLVNVTQDEHLLWCLGGIPREFLDELVIERYHVLQLVQD
jgi:hypothetical protein